MKRILLSVFAAAITAAWVVPASAADVTFSGQYRLRGEYRNNQDFNGDHQDSTDFWGQRIRLTANAKATDDTSVKITLQDTRYWGASHANAGGPGLTDDINSGAAFSGSLTTGSNTVDIHEGYVNVENLFGAPVYFRAGRQELNYGDQRLVGSFGWSNNGRSFDALKVGYKSDMVDVDLFESKIIDTAVTNRDQDFYGAYATVKAVPNNTIDVYVLGLRDGAQTGVSPFGFGTTIGNTAIAGLSLNKAQTLYTIGARLNGAVAGLDYTLEVPFQRGRIQTDTNKYKINAYAAAIKAGYTLPTPMKVRVGVEYNYASGDKDNTNDSIKTFFNLFPTNHDKLGLMDQQAWRNVKAFSINAKADVNEKLSLYAAYWNFKLAQKLDNWYSASQWNTSPTSGLRKTPSTNSSTSVGSEVDLVANYKYNNAFNVELGLARFFAGGYVKDQAQAVATSAGTAYKKASQDWAYLMFTANF